VTPFFRSPWPAVGPWGRVCSAWPWRRPSPRRCSFTTNSDSKRDTGRASEGTQVRSRDSGRTQHRDT
jgi:hypothetical protein